jgi:chromate reductase
VALIVGSLRKDSLNRKLARALVATAPPTLRFTDVPIGDLPMYNQDLDTDHPPPPWDAFRNAIRTADACVFVTPEYNRSLPGGVKNAVDVGSRPGGRSVWGGKPVAVVSVTAGALGGLAGNLALRQTLAGVHAVTMPGPDMFVAHAGTLFDADGQLVNDKTRELLGKFVHALERWVERNE